MAIVGENGKGSVEHGLPSADRHGGNPNSEHRAGAFAKEKAAQVFEGNSFGFKNLLNAGKNASTGLLTRADPAKPGAIAPKRGLHKRTRCIDEKETSGGIESICFSDYSHPRAVP